MEDKIRAERIAVITIESIKQESLKLIEELLKNRDTKNKENLNEIKRRSEKLCEYYYSIQNIGISPGWLFCENFADKPLFILEEYINRHGPNSQKEKLPTDLYNIGFNFLIAQYYKSAELCDNHVTKYKEKRP